MEGNLGRGDEKTPWWAYALTPFVLLFALVAWLIRFWVGLVALLLFVGVILALFGGSHSDGTRTKPTLERRYNQEVVAVINKYELYLRTLPKATLRNVESITPRQLRAEKTAITDLETINPPNTMKAIQGELLNELQRDKTLSEKALVAFRGGDEQSFLEIGSEIADEIVAFNKTENALYRKAKQSE